MDLHALLDEWRTAPLPELAAHLERVAMGIKVPPLAGKTQMAKDVAWDERLAARDPVDLPVLLAHALQRRQSALVPSRMVRALARFPRDPRTTEPLVDALARPSWDNATAHGFWDAVFAALAHHADPRATAMLAALDFPAIWARRQFGAPHVAAIRGMTKRRDKLVLPAVPTATAAQLARFATPSTPRTRSIESLIDAVLAEPARPDLRDVLRDALLELGDPRGEHMALDVLARDRPLTPVEHARQLELASVAWWAPLAKVAMLPQVRDGFLVALHLSAEHAHLLPPLVGDPAWNTVERIDTAYWNLPLPVELFGAMPSLCALGNVQLALAPAIWSREVRWLRTLEIMHLQRSWQNLLNARDAPPNLARLETSQIYDHPADHAWLWSTALFGRLRELTVSLGRAWLGDWYAAVTGPTHAHLQTIELGRFRFDRDDDGRLARLTITLPRSPREQPVTAKVAAQLATLPAGCVASVRYAGRTPDAKQLQVLTAALVPRGI
ncbi:MAG: hypothetical protein NT062_07860 [Proteobacteria bacterium]|nr:hypothetical protein [Pseudomonadota bacterium]